MLKGQEIWNFAIAHAQCQRRKLELLEDAVKIPFLDKDQVREWVTQLEDLEKKQESYSSIAKDELFERRKIRKGNGSIGIQL